MPVAQVFMNHQIFTVIATKNFIFLEQAAG
jgi:hypothetical protein